MTHHKTDLRCAACGGFCPETRRCYATPVCYSCLPAPRPIPRVQDGTDEDPIVFARRVLGQGGLHAIALAVNTHEALLCVLEAAATVPHACTLSENDGGCTQCDAVAEALAALTAERERQGR